MNNSIFISQCENMGIEKAIALSAIKWYSKAIKQDADGVIVLLYELSSFYDALTVCKRLKMYALNRIERNKPITDIETFKGIIDAIIENNGNENKNERSKDTESIEMLMSNGWDYQFFESHFETFENYSILADIVYFIRLHNIADKWVNVTNFDTKTKLGQSNNRQIKKDIKLIFDFMGNKLDGAKITPLNMVKLCTIAKYGYLVG